jgi:hypothetical protein
MFYEIFHPFVGFYPSCDMIKEIERLESTFVSEQIKFHFSYIKKVRRREEVIAIIPEDLDTSFYSQIPDVNETVSLVPSNKPRRYIPLVELFASAAVAILTSRTIAPIIQAWLQRNKTRITIQIGKEGKKIEYEGPNIKHNVAAIKEMIDALAEEAGEEGLQLTAVRIDEDVPPKLPQSRS